MDADIFEYMPAIIGASIGIMIFSIYNIWRKRTGYYEYGGKKKTEKVAEIIVICTIIVLVALSGLIFWDVIIHGEPFGFFKSETREVLAILFPVLLIIGASIGTLISTIYDIRDKKTEEPEHDERTEKVAGKAARSTIVVLMAACAVILWGDIFGLFKFGARETLAILFPVLLFSMLAFVNYYNSKEI